MTKTNETIMLFPSEWRVSTSQDHGTEMIANPGTATIKPAFISSFHDTRRDEKYRAGTGNLEIIIWNGEGSSLVGGGEGEGVTLCPKMFRG